MKTLGRSVVALVGVGLVSALALGGCARSSELSASAPVSSTSDVAAPPAPTNTQATPGPKTPPRTVDPRQGEPDAPPSIEDPDDGAGQPIGLGSSGRCTLGNGQCGAGCVKIGNRCGHPIDCMPQVCPSAMPDCGRHRGPDDICVSF